MRRAADHRLEKRDCVPGHRLETDRPGDIRRATVASPFRSEHPKVCGDRIQVRGPRPRIDPGSAGMEHDHRFAVAMLGIPRAQPVKLKVSVHAGPLSSVHVL